MEINSYVNSVFRFFIFGFISINLWSCSASRISIDVLKMPVTEFTEPVKKIVILNRVGLQYANTKQYQNGRIVAQYNGITDMMVNESIAQLKLDLTANNFIWAFDTVLKYVPKNGRFDNGSTSTKLLSRNVLSKICYDAGVEAVVTVDGYDAEIDSDSKVQYSTPVDRTYGTVKVPYFTGDQSVLMQMLFRIYLCKNEGGKILNETALATQVSISSTGNDPYDVNVNLADANNILIQASRNLGTDYAKQIVPSWRTEYRSIYSTGSNELKEAYKLVKAGNWPAATDIWYLLASSNMEKLAKKASFNLILASEVAGDYELAEEWARRCVNKYQMPEAEKYLEIIKRRKSEIEKLHKVYPLMIQE